MIQMNALCYRQTGPARQVLNLESLPRPAPAKGEVLVQIAVSGANPSDAKARSGLRGGPGYDLVIPHSDGAGAVGAYGVQMAKLAGARRVVASTSGGVKSDHAWAMGADSVVNYRNGDTARAILDATDGRGVDRIVEVEFGGNLDVTRAVLKPNGVIAAYGSMADPEPALPFYPMMFSAQTLRMVLVYLLPEAARAQGIADLTAWLAEGALQHPVSLLAPLDEGWRAHEACEDNARIGAALIEVAKDV